MRSRLPAVLAVLFAVFLSAAYAHADQITLSGGAPGRPEPARAVFPIDIAEIRAYVSLAATLRTVVSFTWLDPSGRPRLRTFKTAFPVKGQAGVGTLDVFEVAGNAASDMPGWWTVVATAGDRKLSARFLLTGSRELVSLVYGEKKEKIAALKGVGRANPDSREIIGMAMGEQDEEVRAASLAALSGITDGWAIEFLKSGQDDPSPLVRLAALRSLLAVGGGNAATAAARAASDQTPDVRSAVAEGALPIEDTAAAKLLGALIIDPDKGVRNAALGTLSRHDGSQYMEALARGFEVDDPAFRRVVMDMAASKEGPGPIPVLEAGLSVPDREIRQKAMRGLAARNWTGTREAMRPLVNDPDSAVAMEGLDILAGLADLPGIELAARSRHIEVRKKAVTLLAGLGQGAGASGLLPAIKDEDPGIRADAAAFFIRQGGPALPGILEKLACDPDPDIRALGMGTLATMPGEASSKALRAYAACGDTGVRQAVIDLLAGRNDKEAEEAIRTALSDPDPGVRLRSTTRLVQTGAGRSLETLARDPDPAVRRMALQSMRKTAGPGMLQTLGDSLNDPDEGVRLAALGVLGDIPGEQSGRYISGALKDGSGEVRGLAASLVMNRRDEGALEGLSLLTLSGPPEKRRNALAAIGDIPGPKADETMLRIYPSSDKDDKVHILKMLAARKSALLPTALGYALGDGEPAVRMTALGLAKGIPEGAAMEFYRAALASGYPELREAVIEWLKSRKDEESMAALFKELDDPVPDLRKRALAYLIAQGHPGIPGRLPGLVQDADVEVRMAAFNAALKQKDGTARADALLAAARGPYPDLAHSALDGLLPLDDARALPLYASAFKDGYRRHDIARAIGRVKDGAAVDALFSVYSGSEDDEGIRLIAVEGLSGRGTEALPALGAAMSDPSVPVRRAALGAIGRTGGIDALRLVLSALEDPALREDALQRACGRRDPEEMEQTARAVAALKDPDFRVRAFELLDKNGLPSPSAAIFLADVHPPLRARAYQALTARTGPEPVFSLLLAGARAGTAGQRAPAEKALREKKTEDMKGGIDLLFERGRAGETELAFVTRLVNDPELLAYTIRRIPPGRDELLRAALGPVISRHAPFDLPAVIEGLKAARNDDDRAALAHALAVIDVPDAGARIAEAYTRYPDIREKLIRSAGGSGRANLVMAIALRDEDAARRRIAAGYLGALKDGGFLLTAIKDPDDAVRSLAAMAACEPANEAVLAVAAADPARDIRKTAAMGLGGLGDEKSMILLKALASDPDPEVSGEALQSLKKLGAAVPSPLWAELASNTTVGKAARLAAVSELSARKEAGNASVLAGMLTDTDPGLAGAARDGLKALGRDGLPALHPLLKDPAARPAALDLLREAGDPSSEEPILAEMPAMDEASRIKAVDALGSLGGPGSLTVLARCYKDGPGTVKVAVVKALGKMKAAGGPETEAILADALEDPSPAIRAQAARTASALGLAALKPAIEKRLAAEKSSLVKGELMRALETLSSTATP